MLFEHKWHKLSVNIKYWAKQLTQIAEVLQIEQPDIDDEHKEHVVPTK